MRNVGRIVLAGLFLAGGAGSRSLAAPTAREIWPDIQLFPVEASGDCIGVHQKREDARQLGLVLDGNPGDLGTADPNQSLVVNFGDTRLVCFDLPAPDSTREQLGRVGEARERYVTYGKGASKKFKITKANAKSIGEMLSLYEAIRKTPGIRKYDR